MRDVSVDKCVSGFSLVFHVLFSLPGMSLGLLIQPTDNREI